MSPSTECLPQKQKDLRLDSQHLGKWQVWWYTYVTPALWGAEIDGFLLIMCQPSHLTSELWVQYPALFKNHVDWQRKALSCALWPPHLCDLCAHKDTCTTAWALGTNHKHVHILKAVKRGHTSWFVSLMSFRSYVWSPACQCVTL